MQLTRFDPAAFLRGHWQKTPVLIRNPWSAWANPLEPDELAGLACEAQIESRLITRSDDGALAMENGPIAEDRFADLTGSWTLLVQAVDQHAPDVAALIEPFRFVPDWRIDDVMVSYATSGGGVGPHYDQYDVFLVQGLGKRRWRVGPRCTADTPLIPHDELRLIADFEASGDWVLEPGDILYVPPGYAHDGVAMSDDCMTYSIGFRAPSRAELIEGWAEHQVDALVEDDRYADRDLTPQAHPGEIGPEAIDRLHAMALDALSDKQAFARWFGLTNSLPKYEEADWRPEAPIALEAVKGRLANGVPLARNPASRFAFIRTGDAALTLFVDGVAFDCAGDVAELAERMCKTRTELVLDPTQSNSALALVKALIDQGSLAFEDED